MSFTLPSKRGLARRLTNQNTLDLLRDWRTLPTRKDAATYAKNFCRTTRAATGLYSVVLMADDSVAMCFFGIRGGFKVVWNYGHSEGVSA